MVGRIFSQRLDREKPLWELWFIEGLEGDRLAVVSKVHHCMVDGVSGSELISVLLSDAPQAKPGPIKQWHPRRTPDAIELGVGEIARVARAPFDLGSSLSKLARDEDGARHHLTERLRAMAATISDFSGSDPVPFNRPVSPHRRIDWVTMPFSRIRDVREAAGGTINDVVLATAAGAMRRYLTHDRGFDVDDIEYRVLAPVSVRAPEEQGALGNRVSAWSIELPIGESDPLERLEIVRRETQEMKETKRALGGDTLTQMTEWTGSGLLSLGARLMTLGMPFNSVITNVPGPRTPLYLLESRMLEIHPHVPLMGTMGMGIALFSYAGTLSWGFSADWDLVPDLHQLVEATTWSFDELHRAALAKA
jgi:WS/DGAT/MGAT family acyltransferase